jgi:hypothetical protein
MQTYEQNIKTLEDYRELHRVQRGMQIRQFIGNLLFDPVCVFFTATLWGIYLIFGR